MDVNEDQDRVVTLDDLYRRSNLQGLSELEVEKEDNEGRSDRQNGWTHVRAIVIGIISSLVAAAIWSYGEKIFVGWGPVFGLA